MERRPLVAANWKMAMGISESIRFVRDFCSLASDLLNQVDVVLCPPYTALWPVSQLLLDLQAPSGAIQLGAQNVAPTAELARSGDISAALIKDTGCDWVMVGHWEIRRRLGEDDGRINDKIHLALSVGLKPFVLVGEASDHQQSIQDCIINQLDNVLAGCLPKQVASMIFVYEPEGAIGVKAPVPVDHVASGCQTIRDWLAREIGPDVARQVRIIYGGSVTPASAALLLSIPDVDGLGASRRGRNVHSLVEITRLVAQSRPGH